MCTWIRVNFSLLEGKEMSIDEGANQLKVKSLYLLGIVGNLDLSLCL